MWTTEIISSEQMTLLMVRDPKIDKTNNQKTKMSPMITDKDMKLYSITTSDLFHLSKCSMIWISWPCPSIKGLTPKIIQSITMKILGVISGDQALKWNDKNLVRWVKTTPL